LLEKYQAGLIAEDEVITKSQDPGTIMDKLRAVQAGMLAEAEEDEE
jgi:hypothetical protein